MVLAFFFQLSEHDFSDKNSAHFRGSRFRIPVEERVFEIAAHRADSELNIAKIETRWHAGFLKSQHAMGIGENAPTKRAQLCTFSWRIFANPHGML